MFIFIPLCVTLEILEEVEKRTTLETCKNYHSKFVPISLPPFWKGNINDECDPGEAINEQDFLYAENRINFYRWVLGLKELRENRNYRKYSQEACAILSKFGRLTHYYDQGNKCWTQEGAKALQNSNLYKIIPGPASLTESIPEYMEDRGIKSLGHRRAIISPLLKFWSGGVKGSYSNLYIKGMKTFDKNDLYIKNVKFVAYPIGIIPIDLCYSRWSISHIINIPKKYEIIDGIEYYYDSIYQRLTPNSYQVNAMNSKGENIIKSISHEREYYGGSEAIIIDVQEDKIKVGEYYIVHIESRIDGFNFSYSVRPVNCNNLREGYIEYSEGLKNILLNPNKLEQITESNEKKAGIIAGIIITVFVVIIIISVIVFIFFKNIKNNNESP